MAHNYNNLCEKMVEVAYTFASHEQDELNPASRNSRKISSKNVYPGKLRVTTPRKYHSECHNTAIRV